MTKRKPKYKTANLQKNMLIKTVCGARFAIGGMTMIFGPGGHGKGLILAYFAAELSRDGWVVVWLSKEENALDMIRPRLEAAGATMENIIIPGKTALHSLAPAHFDPFMANIRAQTKGRIVLLFDPIKDYMPYTEMSQDNKVRADLAPLGDALEKHRMICLALNHSNKNEDVSVANSQMDSAALNNLPRAVFYVRLDPKNNCGRLAQVKINLGTNPPGATFRLKEMQVTKTDPDTKIEGLYDQEYLTMDDTEYRESADDLYARLRPRRGRRTPKLDLAVAFLEGLLAPGEEMDSKLAQSRCDDAGHKPGTIDTARDRLDIGTHSAQGPDGQISGWVWRRNGGSACKGGTRSGRKVVVEGVEGPNDSAKGGTPPDLDGKGKKTSSPLAGGTVAYRTGRIPGTPNGQDDYPLDDPLTAYRIAAGGA